MVNLEDILGIENKILKSSVKFKTMCVSDVSVLESNFKILEKLIALKKVEEIYSRSYSALCMIEKKLGFQSNLIMSLTDDFKNENRDYIEPNYFRKTSLKIPISYIGWLDNINENQRISMFTSKDGFSFSGNDYEYVCKNNIKILASFVNELDKNLSDIEKVKLITNYIESNIKYLTNSALKRKGISMKDISNAEFAFLKGFGICNSIGALTTLLLNNEKMNVNVRCVCSEDHVWNIVKVDNKWYYIDNTWGITRNENVIIHNGIYETKSFSSKYLFFGSDFANEIKYHDAITMTPQIERENILERKLNKL